MLYKRTNKTLLLFSFLCVFCFCTSLKIHAQEKRAFLLHRFDGFSEVLTKDSTKEDLKTIKYILERQGVFFTYSKLKFNANKEIIGIHIKLNNKKSTFSSLWFQKNIPIPNIKIGEINGIVFATSNFEKIKNFH